MIMVILWVCSVLVCALVGYRLGLESGFHHGVRAQRDTTGDVEVVDPPSPPSEDFVPLKSLPGPPPRPNTNQWGT